MRDKKNIYKKMKEIFILRYLRLNCQVLAKQPFFPIWITNWDHLKLLTTVILSRRQSLSYRSRSGKESNLLCRSNRSVKSVVTSSPLSPFLWAPRRFLTMKRNGWSCS